MRHINEAFALSLDAMGMGFPAAGVSLKSPERLMIISDVIYDGLPYP